MVLAGWIAEKAMHSNMGLLMNIVLGIVGAIVGNFLLTLIFGATAAMAIDARMSAHLVGSWENGRSSLRTAGPAAA